MFKKTVLGLILASTLTGSVFAGTITLRSDHPEQYTVLKGDTLWSISKAFLSDPWNWPSVWQKNPQIENPHLIYPGDILNFSFVDGKPQITVQRDSERLSPRIRAISVNKAISAISMDSIAPFLENPPIIGRSELEDSGRVLGGDENRFYLAQGDKLYARGITGDPGTSYAIVRPSEPYINHENKNDILGYRAIHLGTAKISESGDTATLIITKSSREITSGDRLVKIKNTDLSDLVPHVPERDIEGIIIGTSNDLIQIGEGQVIAISLGAENGVQAGHILSIIEKGLSVSDKESKGGSARLPSEEIGTIIVFSVTESLSFAVVADSTRASQVGYMVATPKD